MKPIFIERSDWKGEIFINEIYTYTEELNLSPITQVQAVCFTEDDQVVLYKHIDGYFGLPGGKVEENEDLDAALKREVLEESACNVVESRIFAYVRSYKEKSPEKITYNLRYCVKVKLLDQPVQDPAGKAIERVVVNLNEASTKLNWGDKGKLLIDLASKVNKGE